MLCFEIRCPLCALCEDLLLQSAPTSTKSFTAAGCVLIVTKVARCTPEPIGHGEIPGGLGKRQVTAIGFNLKMRERPSVPPGAAHQKYSFNAN